VGYDRVPNTELSPFPKPVADNENYARAETIREHLADKGFSEVFTSVFADEGHVQVLDKVGGEKPHLRHDLSGIKEALAKNMRNKDILGLKEVKIFEIGTVWKDDVEQVHVASVAENEAYREELLSIVQSESIDNLPRSKTERYEAFSKYPPIMRDIALWTPSGTDPEKVRAIIGTEAGELLRRCELFDTFQKGERTSLAFRLIFQSFEKTLTDEEVNMIMVSVQQALTSQGFEIR
jgi:phenylalanyl-tRNA synthetase beta subunit